MRAQTIQDAAHSANCGCDGAGAEVVDLNAAAREVIALLMDELRRNHVVLRTRLTGEASQVVGHRALLQQVILNLLLNASDALSSVTDRPRELLVWTEQEADGQVRLSVQDSGIGLSAQVMDKLGESFFTTKDRGLGIGLAVCRFIDRWDRRPPLGGTHRVYLVDIPGDGFAARGVGHRDAPGVDRGICAAQLAFRSDRRCRYA